MKLVSVSVNEVRLNVVVQKMDRAFLTTTTVDGKVRYRGNTFTRSFNGGMVKL